MAAVGPPFGQPPGMPSSAWQEYRAADGRLYYSNSITKETQWTKPEAMMTPAERALLNQPWKEYTAEGGRKYWHNTETKQTTWEMPEAYKLATGAATPTVPTTPAGLPQSGGHGDFDQQRDYRDDYRDTVPESRQLTYGSDTRAQAFVPENDEPEYDSREEAEAAFVKLLKRSGVQPDWDWEHTFRVIIKDPQWRAIKDPRDRKSVFEKYCHDIVVQDKERAKERLTKLRADFATMLKSHPEIKHYTHWKTARPMIEGETIFRSTNNESERRQLFEDYVVDLKKAHRESEITRRKSAMDGLIDLLPKLNLEPYTRWSEAQAIITGTQPFQDDEKYKSLSKFDLLTVFQNHMKAVERTFNDSRQSEKNQKLRKERKNRDAFLALLDELRRAGKIKAGTKWSQVCPTIQEDDRYKAMLGQGGSTPQELFWDLVEAEERSIRTIRNDVEDVVDDKRFDVNSKTTFESFLAVMKEDRRTANIDPDILLLIMNRIQERKKEKRTDEDKQTERQQRRAVEDLRLLFKRAEPPISQHDTYDKVKARLSKSEEFNAVTSDEARRGAFERYVRRLREKDEDVDRDRQRRRDRDDRGPYRERERDRDRDRGDRPHTRGGRRSRSPEVDPYEADRRKAIAQRESNHRKSSMAESFLSDQRSADLDRDDRTRDRERDRDRDRDRDRRDRSRDRIRDRERDRRDDRRDRDRDRERDRDPRDRSRDRRRRDDDRPPRRSDEPSHYDRERRDREEERERLYRRRAVPTGGDELNYGEDKRPDSSSAAGGRRRRGDDDDRGSRDSKRLKRDSPRETRDRERERTPHRDAHPSKPSKPAPPPKEDPGVHSGSEEGEIEED